MPEKPFDLAKLLDALDGHSVRYVLIGGIAMAAHGSTLVTQDIDIAYSRATENLEALAVALRGLKPELRGVAPGLPFVFDAVTLRNTINLTLRTTIGDIDLLGETPGASFQQLEANSVKFDLYGHAVLVASLADLLAMKLAADRPKDRLHVLELEALVSLPPADNRTDQDE